jgi:hypothetical protein
MRPVSLYILEHTQSDGNCQTHNVQRIILIIIIIIITSVQPFISGARGSVVS